METVAKVSSLKRALKSWKSGGQHFRLVYDFATGSYLLLDHRDKAHLSIMSDLLVEQDGRLVGQVKTRFEGWAVRIGQWNFQPSKPDLADALCEACFAYTEHVCKQGLKTYRVRITDTRDEEGFAWTEDIDALDADDLQIKLHRRYPGHQYSNLRLLVTA